MYTAVECILRRFTGAPGIAWNISEFIGLSPNLSLDVACSFASISFLDWMWACSPPLPPEKSTPWSLSNYLRSDPHYYRWQFSKSMEVAAAKGDLSIVKWLFSHFSECEVPSSAVDQAAENGHLNVLQFLLPLSAKRQDTDIKSDGALSELLSRCVLHDSDEGNIVYWGHEAIIKAAENGHDDTVRWFLDRKLHELNANQRVGIIEYALGVADFDLVDRLLPSDGSMCVLDYDRLMPGYELIEWMLDLGYFHLDKHLAASAIRDLSKTGCLETMQQIWLLHSPLQKDDELWLDYWCEAVKNGCERGDLPMTRWLLEHPIGCDILQRKPKVTSELLVMAAERGRVGILQYLYEKHTISISSRAVRCAIEGKCFNSAKWLLSHLSSQWSADAVREAARTGNVELLQLFNDIKSLNMRLGKRKLDSEPWWPKTQDLFTAIAKKGHIAGLEWFDQQYLLRKAWMLVAIDYAAANGHFEAVKWLHSKLCTKFTKETMLATPSNDHLDIIKWLHANGHDMSNASRVMELAAERGHFGVVKWLLQGTWNLKFTTDAIEKAIFNGHFQVAYWLHRCSPKLRPQLWRLSNTPPQSFEMLLFLRVHYPHAFTPRFIRNYKEKLTPVTNRNRNVRAWLNEKYPNV